MYNAVLSGGSCLQAASVPDFNVGGGDFTITAMISSRTGGPVVSRLQERTGGFLLTVATDGRIDFYMTNGPNTFVARTDPTPALDGGCHVIAVVRTAKRVRIWLDGSPQTVHGSGSGSPSVNTDNQLPMMIGGTRADPVNRMAGTILNVGFWRSALSSGRLTSGAFAHVSAAEADLAGYWTLNRTTQDLSRNGNPVTALGTLRFEPCVDCVWTDNFGYGFCQMVNAPSPADVKDEALSAAEPITQFRHIDVWPGVPVLYASIMAQSEQPAFPDGALVSIIDPDGVVYNRDVNTDGQFVLTRNGQPWAMAVVDPRPGTWMMSVTAPPTVGFLLQFQTCPAQFVVGIVSSSLRPVLGYGWSDEDEDGTAVEGWIRILTKVAVAALVGVTIAGLVVMTGGAAVPAVVAGLAAFTATGVALSGMVLPEIKAGNLDAAGQQIGGMAGFLVAPGALLLIDANVQADQATQLLYDRRASKLYPYVTASPFNLVQRRLVAEQDRRANVRQELLAFQSGYVSAAGHGRPTYLTGWYTNGPDSPLEEVLTSRGMVADEVRGRIVNISGCHCGSLTADGLGRTIVAHGGVAFFGYSDVFIMPVKAYAQFCDGSIEIDKRLIDGETCRDAYAAAIAKFNHNIAVFRHNDDPPEWIAMMEADRDRLVSPVTDPAYGDPDATLNRGGA